MWYKSFKRKAQVALLQCGLKYVVKIVQRKFIGEADLILDQSNFNSESNVEEDISVQILEVKKLAQKISEEKKLIESHSLDTFTKDVQSELNQKYATFREQFKNDLEMENHKNSERYEQAEETLEILKHDINDLKLAMMKLVSIIQPVKNVKIPKYRKYNKYLVENCMQTEDNYDIVPKEVMDINLPDYALLALKECMMKVATESEKAWVESVLKSLKNLEENYRDIKSLLVSNWEDIYNEFLDCNNILDQVLNIEQTMFGILIFLQQQSVDAQTVRDTLNFFNHKFQKFMLRNENRWMKSCSNLDNIFGNVKRAQEVMKESSANFSDRSSTMIQQLTSLEGLTKEFVCVTELTHHSVKLSSTVKDHINVLVGDVSSLSAKIDGHYCQKINDLSEALQNPREKLYILYKTTEDLRSLSELMKQASLSSSQRQSTITLPISELEESKIDHDGDISDCGISIQDISNETDDIEACNRSIQSDQKQILNNSSPIEEMISFEKGHSVESVNSSILTQSEKLNRENFQETDDNITEAARNEMNKDCFLVTHCDSSTTSEI